MLDHCLKLRKKLRCLPDFMVLQTVVCLSGRTLVKNV